MVELRALPHTSRIKRLCWQTSSLRTTDFQSVFPGLANLAPAPRRAQLPPSPIWRNESEAVTSDAEHAASKPHNLLPTAPARAPISVYTRNSGEQKAREFNPVKLAVGRKHGRNRSLEKMSNDHVTRRCRACRMNFSVAKTARGGWRTKFESTPPSPTCKSHRNSPLCRWAVRRARARLWKQVKHRCVGVPAAFVTLVPPRRVVAFHQLSTLKIEDFLRSARRALRDRFPPGTIIIGWFDIALRDDTRGEARQRWWMPHVHLLIANFTKRDAQGRLRGI
jgi:hypothetical protein